MDTAGYERLMRDHAYWAGQVQDLKRQASDVLWENMGCNHGGYSCIDFAYRECGEMNREAGPFDGFTFEEVWHELDCQGKVCEACKTLRRLKADRMVASRRLGAVRAAITRVGRNLASKED